MRHHFYLRVSRMLPVLSLVAGLSHFAAGAGLFSEGNECLCRHSATFLAAPDASDSRKYAPDRNVDILHLALDVTPDFVQRTVAGQAILTFKPIAKPLEELRLDAVDLNVQSVTSTEKIAGHQVTDTAIIITFAKPIPAGKEAKVTIKYTAEPRKGLYFRTPEMGYKPDETHLFTQGETTEARHWYPGFDSPNEKFTSEITARVPTGMTVLSNGRLVSSERDAKTGLQVVRWSQEKPHANYLLSLVAGHFAKIEDKYHDLPLTFYTPPSDIKEAPESFRRTKDMLEFFEKEIGVPYPWAKYGQVCIRDFQWGGMENTSLTTLTDRTLHTTDSENLVTSESLVAHELAHQWFGDLVTCKDWSHVWLNEGFATYYAHLYMGHLHGRDAMLYDLYNDAQGLLLRTTDTRGIVSRKFNSPDDQFTQFGALSYPKGGWVLHMLRSELGEDLYRRCIKTYLERHQYGSVVTEDLNVVIEELSGRSFDQFFDQWVYHAQHPQLDVNYSWDEKTKLAKVSIKQTQKISDEVLLFKFPLTLRFKGKSGVVEKQVQVKEKEEDFYFPLKEAPEVVRLDPALAVLAKINFKVPNAMLYAQLADKTDMVGRLLAIEQLAEKKEHESVAKLKEALNNDAFYGVRVRASGALRGIHSDQALEALLAATSQGDARVRQAVLNDLAGFYHPSAYEQARKAADAEKNPVIQASAIRALGAYAKPEVRETLLKYLNSDSYRQRLAEAAIGAIRTQDDTSYLVPLRESLTRREADLPTSSFAAGLGTLAFLARNQEKKDGVREFLAGFVTHKKNQMKLAALAALGTLGDPKAIAVLEKFTTATKESLERQVAETALTALNAAKKPSDSLRELRNEVLDLQKGNRDLRKELDDLKKKLEAGSPPEKQPVKKQD